jgi:hypothetical protein
VEAESSDLDSTDEEDEDLDIERDEEGNFIVFKKLTKPEQEDGNGGEEDENEDELNEKFLALRSTKQIQILLVTLKT